MDGTRASDPHAIKKRNDRGRPVGQPSERLAAAIAHGLRAGEPTCREVFDQIEKERQSIGRNAFFVKRQNEKTIGRMEQKIGVLDALGNTFVGEQATDAISREELLQFLVGNVGIDGHGGSCA